MMFWDFCHPEVMVMERMKGVPITQVERLREAGVDIPKLARDGVTIFFTQVFRDGFFHADMHPGNIQVSLEPATFGRYISLDFGIIGTLTESDKEYLAQNFAAFFRRDYKRVAELHLESGWVPPGTRIDELEGGDPHRVRAVLRPPAQGDFARHGADAPVPDLAALPCRDPAAAGAAAKDAAQHRGAGPPARPRPGSVEHGQALSGKVDARPARPASASSNCAPRHRVTPRSLPSLPRLLHDFLKHPPGQQQNRELLELLKEQRHTNRLLQALVYGGIGFVLGLIVMQVLVRVRLF